MKQYISKITNDNFVYPNNKVKEYDVEIVHEIEDFSVSGSVVNLSASTINTTGITFNLDYVWLRNNAEVFIKNNGNLSILSVHMMAPGQSYFRPWRVVQTQETATTNINTLSALSTFTVFPSQLGLTSFSNGMYYFEIRFIGHRAVFPVCYNLEINPIPTTPTPTPMPSPTPTPMPSPTPEPTPPPVSTFSFCGRGNTIADSCNDAIFNSRTFYSNCSTSTFGVGCYVYTDSGGTIPLTGYSYVFMNGANWDVNSSTGVVTAYSATQC